MTERKEYANQILNIADWKHTVTIRPPHKVNAVSGYNLVQRLANKIKSIIYFTIEKDRDTNHKHLHLLLDKQTSIEEVYKKLRMNRDCITYSEPLNSPKDMAEYMNKHIDNNNINLHHDLCLPN